MQSSKKPVVANPTQPRAKPRVVAHNSSADQVKRMPIGELLVKSGALDPSDLLKALALRDREETKLGNILINHNMVSEADLYGALSMQFGADLMT